MARQVPFPHPGEILLNRFLKPMKITPYKLAKDIGVPQTRISGIVHGKRAITADTALRLSRYFGLTEGYWIRGQAAYDAAMAKEQLEEELAKIQPYQAAA
jgi:addiction module antidote protein, HigA family